MNRAIRFSAVYAALTAAHEVADHWVQTDAQATAKGAPGGSGAYAAHVATYTATQALAMLLTSKVTGLRLRPARAVLALGLSAATHYAADRSAGHWKDPQPASVPALAYATGSGQWIQRDPNAAYILDQSWHKGWIFAAALIAAGGNRP